MGKGHGFAPPDKNDATGRLNLFGDTSRNLSEMEIQAIRRDERPSRTDLKALTQLGTSKAITLAISTTFLGLGLRPIVERQPDPFTASTLTALAAAAAFFLLLLYLHRTSSNLEEGIKTRDELDPIAQVHPPS